MKTISKPEARIVDTNNILVVLGSSVDNRLLHDFFGSIVTLSPHTGQLPDFTHKSVYLCGDLSLRHDCDLRAAQRTFVISDWSHGDNLLNGDQSATFIDAGQVPIRVHGVGVYYRRFFDLNCDYFNAIRTEHAFQFLTESTKPGVAHRTGIYLTPVKQDGEELHFRLLRCSTNLSGPTENFRASDQRIVDALNQESNWIFWNHAPLNHVLAQIYHNTHDAAAQKQTKAKISAHADKTKDMPTNGIMAFCTFYDQLDKLQPLARDHFDYGHRGISGLTRLHFRLKSPVAELPAEFSVPLYPNSVFFMPLSTNRLYTHEIRSSMLDAELLPTRLGYVVRCSGTEAVHKNGHTFLKRDGTLAQLVAPTPEGMSELRRLYAEENKTQGFIDYGDQFLFSMNTGDYLAPRI